MPAALAPRSPPVPACPAISWSGPSAPRWACRPYAWLAQHRVSQARALPSGAAARPSHAALTGFAGPGAPDQVVPAGGRGSPRCVPQQRSRQDPAVSVMLGSGRLACRADDVGGMRGTVSRKGWVLFAVMCLVWGIPYLFIKVAVGQVSVPVVVFARTAIGALILLPLAIRSARQGGRARQGGGEFDVLHSSTGGRSSPSPRWRSSFPGACFLEAERKLPSSLAGLLIAAVPIISVVTARLTGGGTERLSPRRWVAWSSAWRRRGGAGRSGPERRQRRGRGRGAAGRARVRDRAADRGEEAG